MKISLLTQIFLLSVILFSCVNNNETQESTDSYQSEIRLNSVIPTVNDEFQSFLDQFPNLQFPIEFEGCNVQLTEDKKLDKIYSNKFESNSTHLIGTMLTNGNYIAVLTVGTADCYLPILTTYKLTGEKIDSKTIAVGGCGDGPCYECKEYMKIDNHLNIYTSNKIIFSECDEDYNSIPKTETKEEIFRKGNLTPEGIIKLSQEQKK
ncbi:MAG: hypothetical protein ACJARP_002015 [Vicingaceae bacterium]|jgi:hypothetical protein